MASVGIRDLKQNASAVVARAAAGERITITDRGRPVAQITPLPAPTLERVAQGLVRPPLRPFDTLPTPLPVDDDGPTASEILQELREDRI